MRVLTSFAALLAAASFFGCTPAGPLTPRDAFLQLRAAYLRSDEEAMMNCLSRSSIESINGAIALMEKMGEKRSASVGKLYGLGEKRMRNLTVRDIIAMHFEQERKTPSISRAVRYEIIVIERDKDRATVKVENGMELLFVREGPYWKFDLSSY